MNLLQVMTFNVRQPDDTPEEHSWERRRDLVVETIGLQRPALLGTQEIHMEQAAYILSHLPQYEVFGRGRYGDARDKHNLIFYDRSEFAVLERGEKWFSMTPDTPGSRDWGIPKPRMVTWGRLKARDGTEVGVLNTHLPYGKGADDARHESARILGELLLTFAEGCPVLLMGDFNAPAGGHVHQLLTGVLEDAWLTAESVSGPESTLHGFGRFVGPRMDWILSRHLGKLLCAATVTYAPGGVYPSDHYPVCATFDFRRCCRS